MKQWNDKFHQAWPPSYLWSVFSAEVVLHLWWAFNKYLRNWIEFSEDKEKVGRKLSFGYFSVPFVCNSMILGRLAGKRESDGFEDLKKFCVVGIWTVKEFWWEMRLQKSWRVSTTSTSYAGSLQLVEAFGLHPKWRRGAPEGEGLQACF